VRQPVNIRYFCLSHAKHPPVTATRGAPSWDRLIGNAHAADTDPKAIPKESETMPEIGLIQP
jgi:hypothetical protein